MVWNIETLTKKYENSLKVKHIQAVEKMFIYSR